jgi:hypothetical protein
MNFPRGYHPDMGVYNTDPRPKPRNTVKAKPHKPQLWICCTKCKHRIELDVEALAPDLSIAELGSRARCSQCGAKGCEVKDLAAVTVR